MIIGVPLNSRKMIPDTMLAKVVSTQL